MFKIKLTKYLFGIFGFIFLLILSGASLENKFSSSFSQTKQVANGNYELLKLAKLIAFTK